MDNLFSLFDLPYYIGLLGFLKCLLLIYFRLLCFYLITFYALCRICGNIESLAGCRLGGWYRHEECKCWNHVVDRIDERGKLEIHDSRILFVAGGCGCLFRGSFGWRGLGLPSDLDEICFGFILSLLKLILMRFLVGLVSDLLFLFLLVFYLIFFIFLEFQIFSWLLILSFITS